MKGGMQNTHSFGNWRDAIGYSVAIVAVMWLVQWAQFLYFDQQFYHWGLLPRSAEGLKGIVFMPFIHAKNDLNHIINNSLPSLILFSAVFYYYRDIAWRVFLFIWFGTGIALWLYAENRGAYHIGMSGVIYGLVGFLFTSGVLRKYLPLQAVSLTVVFIYGSLIWGIFPIKAQISWEGHFMGLVAGVLAALLFRKQGVQAPKYQYEIEKEMGIEPPDLEAIWRENVRREEELAREKERREQGHIIVYHYRPEKEVKNKDNSSTIPPDESSK